MLSDAKIDTQNEVILIVDDAISNVKILAAILDDMGCDILFATNGANAIEIAKKSAPDIILLDIIMPEMDGHEACRILKKDPKTSEIPIIFITALDNTDNEEEGLKLGAIDYIAKPFSAAIVKARISNHLALRRANKALRVANLKLERLATLDSLTDTFNRRHFMDLLTTEINRHDRYGSDISILMLDIDFFKKVNDTYGHAAGDKALITVVKFIKNTLRETDSIGRLGGEEFAVLLPETNAQKAIILAERLRGGIEDAEIEAENGEKFSITASIGLYSEALGKHCLPEYMLGMADKALYHAKNTGRNRVVDFNTVAASQTYSI